MCVHTKCSSFQPPLVKCLHVMSKLGTRVVILPLAKQRNLYFLLRSLIIQKALPPCPLGRRLEKVRDNGKMRESRATWPVARSFFPLHSRPFCDHSAGASSLFLLFFCCIVSVSPLKLRRKVGSIETSNLRWSIEKSFQSSKCAQIAPLFRLKTS